MSSLIYKILFFPMTTATKNSNVLSLRVVNTALNLLSQGHVRLHKDSTLPTVNFRDRMSVEAKYNASNSFRDLINRIETTSGNYSNDMTVSITGLLAIALALCVNKDITTTDVQNNSPTSDEWFRAAGFADETTNLIEYAFYPWTKISSDSTLDERAACNYQRRIRTIDGNCSDNQTAYRKLAQQILMNMRNNNGKFVPAREDYRAADRTA